jgi:protein phosphatase
VLEHPAEAFDAFRRDGVARVVCEEKHMGSRAVVVVCRDDDIASRRFGVGHSDHAGAIYTRTGRAFFDDATLTQRLLDRLRGVADAERLWDELETDWLVLDAELLPWSAKAEGLLRTQYAPVGAAATAALRSEKWMLEASAARVGGDNALAIRAQERLTMAECFIEAYRRYCWPVDGLDGIALAPFQILAGEGRAYALEPHPWHMQLAGRLAGADPQLLRATATIEVVLDDPASEAAATAWWEDLTAGGGEGMVVKPRDVVARTGTRLAQPGIKCRGREYLRIIYGPEYTSPEQLARLRERGLGHKRALAVREFALGIEALERFVRGEPLYRVHECVFGVLALESEPVDPRL